jgi:hypothetical protein
MNPQNPTRSRYLGAFEAAGAGLLSLAVAAAVKPAFSRELGLSECCCIACPNEAFSIGAAAVEVPPASERQPRIAPAVSNNANKARAATNQGRFFLSPGIVTEAGDVVCSSG